MNLYVIRGVLVNWSAGMVVIKAKDLDACRQFFIKEFVDLEEDHDSYLIDYDHSITQNRYSVLKLADDDQTEEGIVQYIFGGD